MAARTEQYDYRGTRTSWRKWKASLKRQTARKARRDGRTLREDAPPRRTGGWVS